MAFEEQRWLAGSSCVCPHHPRQDALLSLVGLEAGPVGAASGRFEPPPSPRFHSSPIASVQSYLFSTTYSPCLPSPPLCPLHSQHSAYGRCTAAGRPLSTSHSLTRFSLRLSLLHVCFISSPASASCEALLCSPYFAALPVLFCMWLLPLSIQSPQGC